MPRINVKAKSITQLNAGEYTGTKSSRDGHLQKFHAWINLENLINNSGECQCGWPVNTYIGTLTFYGIKGFRDTSPIATKVGTYPQPAMLKIDNFNFDEKNLRSLDISIKGITFKFDQRMMGCAAGTGVLYKGCQNAPRFSKVDLELYIEYKNGTVEKIPTVGPKLNCNNSTNTVQALFPNLNINYKNVKELSVRIQYPRNEYSNPGIIYLKNLSVDVDFEYNEEKAIFIQKDKSELVTDSKDVPNNQSCRTSVTHTIKCTGEDECAKMIQVENPYDFEISGPVYSADKREVKYTYWDKSGKPGVKFVKYNWSGAKGSGTKVDIESKKPQTPDINFTQIVFKKGTSAPIKDIIEVKNGCFYNFELKVIEKAQPVETFASYIRQPNGDNLITVNNQELFNKIINRPCGGITFGCYIDGEKVKTIGIAVREQDFDVSILDLEYEYTQDKEHSIKNITIKRTDEEPDEILDITVYDESTGVKTYHLRKNETVQHEISIYRAGTFNIYIDMDTYCRTKRNYYSFNVLPNHKQFFDELFLRSENGSAVCYDSVTIMEGDGLPYLIKANNLDPINDLSDLRICSSDSKSIVNRMGYIPLILTNTNPTESINNLRIELNPFVFDKDEKISAYEEWTGLRGIFVNFFEDFYRFNDTIEGLVSIENLTPDEDYIDSENVFLTVKEVKPNESLELKLPFNAGIEKKVYMNFLLFEEPLPINKIGFNGECSRDKNNNNYIVINVTDPIFNTLTIDGQTDLNNIEQVQCGDGYKTKLTYTAKNLDTITTSNPVNLLIQNSIELIPYKIKFKNQEIDVNKNIEETFFGSNGRSHIAIKKFSAEKPIINALLRLKIDDTTYYARTDNNGYAIFNYIVPLSKTNGMTLTDVLNNGLISYSGDNENQEAHIGLNAPIVLKTDKALTFLKINRNYRIYNPGALMKIKVQLYALTTEFKNQIEIIEPFDGKEIKLDVWYYTCQKNKKLSTVFKTNDSKLIENSTSKIIYCGVPTNLGISANLSTRILQENSLNTLNLNILNLDKPNKEVEVIIDLLNNENNDNPADYEVFDSSINTKDYWIEDGVIHWVVGEMKENESISEYFRIKAKNIGLSKIKINAVDYLDKEG